jgi:hypothetical protein
VPEPAVAGGDTWRTIDELAALVGAYCWIEQRIFEVTGAWATGPGPVESHAAELRVWSAATSRRHGNLAGRWAERLPSRAGVESASLVTAPAAPKGLAESFGELGAMTDLTVGVAALVETVLPWVSGVYAAHLAVAAAVSEAPVMEVLVGARREASAEIRGGRTLLGRIREGRTPSGHLGERVKRAFAVPDVSPAVWPG